MRHRRETTTLRGRRALVLVSLVIFAGILVALATVAIGIVDEWNK